MLNGQRVFFSDNGVITDYTRQLNDFRSTDKATIGYVAGEDHLYIGSDYPFNNQFVDLSAVNAAASVMNIKLWAGENEGWKDAVDIIDFTSSSGVSLSNAGHFTWKRDRDEPWSREDESTDVVGLETAPLIYGFYWIRLSWNANITTTISYIGNRFSNDDELYSLYPDLNNQTMRDQWDRGNPSGTKTTWDEQSFVAADAIIRALKTGDIVVSDSQLMDFEIFKDASIHKTAEIIYGGMGRASQDDKVNAKTSYKDAINIKNFGVDLSRDGNLSRAEKATSATYMRR